MKPNPMRGFEMKIILGCAAGAALALLGAPTAAADVNISGINIGNEGNAHATLGNFALAGPGATASATGGVGNAAVALNGGKATVQGGVLNVAVANGKGEALVNGGSNVNFVVANDGGARAINGSSFNVVVGHRGLASASNSRGGIVLAGPDSTASVNNGNVNFVVGSGTLEGVPPGQGAGSQASASGNFNVQVALCGGSAISAQSNRITLSAPCVEH